MWFSWQRALARMHGQPWHEARERMAADPDPPTRERINSDAQEKWDSVLHYLVPTLAHAVACVRPAAI